MATSKEYAQFVLDQLAMAGDVRLRAMMGEYVIYYRDKVIGGIYDGRFLVKNVPAARGMMPQAPLELPYPGAKEMLLVEEPDEREFLAQLLDAMYEEVPVTKKKRK